DGFVLCMSARAKDSQRRAGEHRSDRFQYPQKIPVHDVSSFVFFSSKKITRRAINRAGTMRNPPRNLAPRPPPGNAERRQFRSTANFAEQPVDGVLRLHKIGAAEQIQVIE